MGEEKEEKGRRRERRERRKGREHRGGSTEEGVERREWKTEGRGEKE